MSAADRYFVDANLILYYVDPLDSRKQARATEWLEALWVAGAGCLSWQVLHEFYWNAVRKVRLEPARAREIVEDLAHWKPVDTILGLVQQAWHWTDSAQQSVPAPGTCYRKTFSPTGTTTRSWFSTRSTNSPSKFALQFPAGGLIFQ
jgi:hypothetical protein